jgi:hypothetical protein
MTDRPYHDWKLLTEQQLTTGDYSMLLLSELTVLLLNFEQV